MAADLFGDRQGLIDAGADGGALQVIAGQPETGKARATFCDCGQSVAVTEVVLREGSGPNRDIGKDGITFHREDRGDLAVHENCQFFGLQFCCVSVGCSADETGQKSVAFRSAAGEERGVSRRNRGRGGRRSGARGSRSHSGSGRHLVGDSREKLPRRRRIRRRSAAMKMRNRVGREDYR